MQINFKLFYIMTLCLITTNVFSMDKKFNVEQGKVIYSIKGNGILTDDANISISGMGELRFTSWGNKEVIEEDYNELTKGSIQDLNSIRSCKKYDHGQMLNVNAKSDKIFTKPILDINVKTHILSNLKKTGVELIAGHNCDVWEGHGVKECLYKGVPLLLEHYIFGVYYSKKAISVDFNTTVDETACKSQDLELKKFELFKTKIKRKSIKPPEELRNLILQVLNELAQDPKVSIDKLDELSAQEKRVVLNKLGNNIYTRQVKFLPKYLKEMQHARVCLQGAKNYSDITHCSNNIMGMRENSMGLDPKNKNSWKNKNKQDLLSVLEKEILTLQAKMPCIRSSKNITDLSACMK